MSEEPPFTLRIDRNVPPGGSADALTADAGAWLEGIMRNLPEAIADNDFGGAYYGCRGVLHYTKMLFQYIRLKYPIPFAKKRVLANMLYAFVTSPANHGYLEINQCMYWCLLKLIKKKDVHDLELPWRPLYDTLQLHLSESTDDNRVASRAPVLAYVSAARSYLVEFVRKARYYFPKSATAEITAELIPKLEPFTDDYFKHQTLLCLLLPAKHGKDLLQTWLPKLMKISLWSNDSISVRLWFRLWARVAKHNVGEKLMEPYMTDLFTLYLQKINIGSGNPNQGSEKKFPAKYRWLMGSKVNEGLSGIFGKLLVYTLHLKQCRDLLSNFCQLTKTYFHPSNTGRHLSPLAGLLSGIGTYYGRRIGRERRKEANYAPEFNLDTKDPYLVNVLFPLLKMAIYSKSYKVLAAAQSTLRMLCNVHPDLVLPALMQQWIPALKNVTQSHRTMSALSCLSWVGDAALNRGTFPSGSTYLEDMLWLTLPGIDPVDLRKTGKTLAFYTLLFYTVPLIDARTHKGGSSDSKSGDDETEEQAQRATMCFKEWCPRFLDQVMTVIRQQEGFTKENHVDRATHYVIQRCLRAFFGALSAPLATLCLKHVARYITDADFWPVSKYAGCLTYSIGLTHPKEGLSVLFPLLCGKILEEAKVEPGKVDEKAASYTSENDGKTWVKKEGVPGAAAKHCLYLLSRLTRQAGEAVVEHLPQVKAIYSVYIASKSSSERQYAGRVLRGALRALTRTYPREYRGHASKKWGDASWRHWNDWGKVQDYKSLEIDWHVPSQSEARHAADLAQFAVARALEKLEAELSNNSGSGTTTAGDKKQHADINASSASASAGNNGGSGASSSSKSESICNCIQEILNVIRGATTFLGEFEGPKAPVVVAGEEVKVEENKGVFRMEGAKAGHLNGFVLRVEVGSGSDSAAIKIKDCRAGEASSLPTLRMFLAQTLTSLMDRLTSIQDSSPRKKRRVENSKNNGDDDSDVQDMQVESTTTTPDAASGPSSGTTNVKVLTTLAECISALLNLWQMNYTKLKRWFQTNETSRRSRREAWTNKKCSLRTLNIERAYYLHHMRVERALRQRKRYTGLVVRCFSSLQRLCLNDFAKVRTEAAEGLIAAALRYPMAVSSVVNGMAKVITSAESSKEELIGALWILSSKSILADVQDNLANEAMLLDACFSGTLESFREDKVQATTHRLFLRILQGLKLPHRPLPLEGKAAGERKARTSKLLEDAKQYDLKLGQILESLCKTLGDGEKSQMHWRYRLVGTSAALQLALSSASFPPCVVRLLTSGIGSDIFALRQLSIRGLAAIMYASCVYKPEVSSSPQTPTDDAEALACMEDIKTKEEWNADPTSFLTGDPLGCGRRPGGFSMPKESLKHLGEFMSENSEKFFSALEENHPTLAPDAGSRKKQGAASDIMSIVEARLDWLQTYTSSDNGGVTTSGFDPVHVRLLRLLFACFPGTLPGVAGKIASKLVESDEKEKQCLAAEIVAGLSEFGFRSASVKGMGEANETILPVVQSVLKNGNQDTVAMWCDSLTYSLRTARASPRRLSALIRTLCSGPFSGDKKSKNGSGESYRQLRLLRTVLDECSWRVLPLGQQIVTKLKEFDMLSHPYKQVRSEVGNLLASVTRAGYRFGGSPSAFLRSLVGELKSALEPLLSSKADSSSNVDKRVISMANVAIQWMIPCTYFGQTVYFQDLLLPLLPAVLHLQQNSDAEAASRAKFCVTTWAWGSWNVSWDTSQPTEEESKTGSKSARVCAVDPILLLLRSLRKGSNWHVRKQIAKFLTVFVPRHAFVISGGGVVAEEPHPSLKTVKATLVNLLSDPQVEVREEAAVALRAMLTSVPGSGGSAGGMGKMTQKMQKKLYKMSRTEIPAYSQDEKAKEERAQAISKRHGGLLGLSAMIFSQPYDVPEWLPHILIGLAEHTRDTIPISTSAKKLFQEFTRTHQDEWHIFEEKFTEKQLDTLRDCGSSLTYFA